MNREVDNRVVASDLLLRRERGGGARWEWVTGLLSLSLDGLEWRSSTPMCIFTLLAGGGDK